jgi:hypothetical protein
VPVEQLAPLQVWFDEHTEHVPPPVPHAFAAVPATQVLFWQQPEGHVVGLQFATHALEVQLCVEVQVAHAAPPVPQAWSVAPSSHTPLRQQPVGQFCELHAARHCPPLQERPEPQVVHALPPLPQAAVAVPSSHTFPLQQPFGHVADVQLAFVTQRPAEQACPPPQLEQVPPALPHADVEVPSSHTLPLQQPVGHVVALQLDAVTQRPEEQLCPPPQLVHEPPPLPHADVEVPSSHTLPLQQPLGHVDAEQLELATHRPALHTWPLPHSTHCAPPVPHDVTLGDVSQSPNLQQPVGQVLALHVEPPTHWLSEQRRPSAQALHASPPDPHALSLPPARHTPSRQHPPQV